MKLLKFIKPWSMYSPGDIAGFEEDRATAIVKTGAAELHEDSDDEPTGEEAPQPDHAALEGGGEAKPAGRKAK